MTPLSSEQVIARLKQLPSLPSAVSEVLASFGNEDADVDTIAQQIARDQALAARVLRVANSSFYGLQTKVGTIHEAVVILGFRAVRSMVLAVGMNGAFRVEQCPGFDAPSYLKHGVGVALAARAMAPLMRLSPEIAFTAGLLHDIGVLVLASSFSRQYAEALAYRKQHDCFVVEAERRVLGIDHAEVGGLLAETWRFPAAIRDAITYHHSPADAPADSFANLIHVADATIRALGLSGAANEMVPPLDPIAWRRIGGNWDAYRQILPEIERDFEEAYQTVAV
ncbi:MAG TPA: HDOD domain-containing protein [Rhodocyclaceae bacterium]|nr:HDOD domain-containing protein [Rhodocyclaceae bacterium]